MKGITGFGRHMDFQVMNSSQKTDEIIKLCRQAESRCQNPYFIQEEIYRKAGVYDLNDLMWYDVDRIKKELIAACRRAGLNVIESV